MATNNNSLGTLSYLLLKLLLLVATNVFFLVDENEVERPEEENARLVKFLVDAYADCAVQWSCQQIVRIISLSSLA